MKNEKWETVLRAAYDAASREQTAGKKQETVAACLREVRTIRAGFFAYLSAVFRKHGAGILLSETLALLFTMSGIHGSMPERIVGIVPIYIPLFVFAVLPNLLRGGYFRMDEIETATRSANVQLLFAKLLITGAADVVCFSVLLAMEWRTIGGETPLLWLLLYIFVPYLSCLWVFLRHLRRGGTTRNSALVTLGFGIAFCALSYSLPALYLPSMAVLWLVFFGIFSLFFIREIFEMVRMMRKGAVYGTCA